METYNCVIEKTFVEITANYHGETIIHQTNAGKELKGQDPVYQ